MFKGLSNLTSLIKQAQQIGGQMQGLTEELKKRRAVGAAGGGLVEIEVNGVVEVLRCTIDPQLIAQGDREMIEDLVASAVNQAIFKAKQMHAEAMKELTGGMPLPGLQDALGKMMGMAAPTEENETDGKEPRE